MNEDVSFDWWLYRRIRNDQRLEIKKRPEEITIHSIILIGWISIVIAMGYIQSHKMHSSMDAFRSRVNTLRPRQNGRNFADDTLNGILLNENIWFSINVSLTFLPKGRINNIPALVQIMAWRRPGDKPLSEPMLVFVPTHICVTRPQWVNVHVW